MQLFTIVKLVVKLKQIDDVINRRVVVIITFHVYNLTQY